MINTVEIIKSIQSTYHRRPIRMDRRRPDPRIVLLAQQSQPNAVLCEQLNRLITPSHCNELAIGKVGQRQCIEAQRPILADHLAAQRIERNRLAPIDHAYTVRRHARRRSGRHRSIAHRRIARYAIDRAAVAARSFDARLLLAGLVSNRHRSVVQTEHQVLAVVRPVAAIDSRRHFVLLHRLLLGRPKSKVGRAARGELM